MNNYIIRKALPEDAVKYSEYLSCIFEESDFLLSQPDEINNSIEKHETFIQNCNEIDNFLFLVAEYKGEIIGNLIFRGGEKKKIKHTGEFGVTVLRSYWGRGIAGKLIKEMLKWAEEENIVTKINLKVREDNKRAIDLYRRNGFKKEGNISKYFNENGKYYNAVVMGIDIESGFHYDISFSKDVDIITVRDFYCSYSTWKVPVLTGAWEEMITNSAVFITIWDHSNLIGAARALSDKVRWATIVDVLVDPDYRNKGVGTQLMKALLAKEEMQVRSIFLSSDEAEGFYEKLGFSNINNCCAYMVKTNMESEDSFILPV